MLDTNFIEYSLKLVVIDRYVAYIRVPSMQNNLF